MYIEHQLKAVGTLVMVYISHANSTEYSCFTQILAVVHGMDTMHDLAEHLVTCLMLLLLANNTTIINMNSMCAS